VIDDLARRPPGAVFVAGTALVLLGPPTGHWPGRAGPSNGTATGEGFFPSSDLAVHSALLRLVADVVADAICGWRSTTFRRRIGLALAECAVHSGLGCVVESIDGQPSCSRSHPVGS